jgi:hypothetical protein
MNVNLKRGLMTALTVLVAGLALYVFAQDMSAPEILDLSRVGFQIVDARFVLKLEGTQGRFAEGHPDKYRGLVVTLKITKQAGAELALACQDISLHYRYGNGSDIAKCYGLSTFSDKQDEDRAMALYTQGWGRTTTGPATTRSSTVFVDVFFQNMEPETRDLYLFIAQPTGAEFTTSGWKKE